MARPRDVGTVSGSQSLLLRPTDRLRFLPHLDFNGSNAATIQYRAWDQTYGLAGTRLDGSAFTAGVPFSSGSPTATLSVTAVNDRPVLDTTGFPTPARAAWRRAAGGDSLCPARHGRLGRRWQCGGPGRDRAGRGRPWKFPLDGGSSWSAIGPVSAASAGCCRPRRCCWVRPVGRVPRGGVGDLPGLGREQRQGSRDAGERPVLSATAYLSLLRRSPPPPSTPHRFGTPLRTSSRPLPRTSSRNPGSPSRP